MNCRAPGCHGEYEIREVVHTVTYRAARIAITGVPAAICLDCGHTVVGPEALGRLDTSLRGLRAVRPSRSGTPVAAGWRTIRCAP
jgi:YgiT-type zinc finger domain-containing protein